MSAACSHVIVPLKARMRTSWIFMARSTAAAGNTIGTSLVADGCTPADPNSGHSTCSRERTDHVLPTDGFERRDFHEPCPPEERRLGKRSIVRTPEWTGERSPDGSASDSA